MKRVEDSLPSVKKQKEQTPLRRTLMRFLFGILLGGSALPAILAVPITNRNLTFLAGMCVFIVLMLFTSFFTTLIHEAGHLVFGLVSGYEFFSFRIFNIVLIRQDGAYKIRRFGIAGTAGQCLMKPPPWVGNTFPYFLYNFGGVIMNLAGSVVFYIVALLVAGNPFLLSFFLMMCFQGVFCAISNGIPDTIRGLPNDGKNIVDYGKSTAALREFWFTLQIIISMNNNVRMKDLPADWFPPISENELRSNAPLPFALIHLDRFLEEEKWEEAAGLLEMYLKPQREIPGYKRNVAQAELVFLECILKQRPDRLKELLSEEHLKYLKMAQKDSPSIFRTLYCYLLFIEKNEDKASEHRSRFEKLFKHYPYSYVVESAHKEMDLALSVFKAGKESVA
jgi:hypothetical protein